MDFAGLGITPLAPPANEAPYIIYGWIALGIGVLIYFLATDRSRIARTGLVFEEPEIEPSPAESATPQSRTGAPAPVSVHARSRASG